MTKLGDLFQFGQLFKACNGKYFAQIVHILGNFVKLSKYFIFLVKSFLGYFLLVTLATPKLLQFSDCNNSAQICISARKKKNNAAKLLEVN